MDETKICKKCGRILPIQNFRLATGQQHKDKIPNKIYQAMMNWQIEITD